MSISFCSFSSGSSGNCYLIQTDETALLVDAGISAKRIIQGIDDTNTPRDKVKGVLVTHEHSDHVRGVRVLLNKEKGMKAYANEKTWSMLPQEIADDQRDVFQKNRPFFIGDIEVKAFPVFHDAVDPVGFSFYAGEKQISVVTDTGCITDDLLKEISNADILVLEANHDVNMLKYSRYPWYLKQRILGDNGHLSNETAAKALVGLLSDKIKERCVLLAHLSRENNFPDMAYQTVKNVLEEENFYIGTHLRLNTIIRDELSTVYSL